MFGFRFLFGFFPTVSFKLDNSELDFLLWRKYLAIGSGVYINLGLTRFSALLLCLSNSFFDVLPFFSNISHALSSAPAFAATLTKLAKRRR